MDQLFSPVTSAKRNRSQRRVGRGRGVSVRLARGIAQKHGLAYIVIFTYDKQFRSRLLYYASTVPGADQAAQFCCKLGKELGWDSILDFDCSSVRRLKQRIKDLELALAQVYEGEGDAKTIVREALRLPAEL